MCFQQERELKMCFQLFFISTVQGIDFRLGKYPRLTRTFSWGDGLNQLTSFWEIVWKRGTEELKLKENHESKKIKRENEWKDNMIDI